MSEDWIKTAGLDQRLVERCLNAEARVEELEATVTNVIRWLNGGCSVEPAIEELNLVMEQSNDE
jgi:hypothetical protein